jgi:tungstate transport system ATP-binding protein
MERLIVKDLRIASEQRSLLSVEEAIFRKGAMYGIVGPSGAGKSTFLRVLNFLQRPNSGVANFWGEEVDLTALSPMKSLPLQRMMAFVAQKPVMFHASVFDNVALGLRFRRLDKRTIRERVMAALEQVGLQDHAAQQAVTLSGGEAQRIALARAIVLQPRLILLDEPTANLDPINVSIFEQVVKSIHEQGNTTIIIVTHNFAQAKRLTEECLFIYKGRIEEWSGTPAFFSSPRSQVLDDFLTGRMIY